MISLLDWINNYPCLSRESEKKRVPNHPGDLSGLGETGSEDSSEIAKNCPAFLAIE